MRGELKEARAVGYGKRALESCWWETRVYFSELNAPQVSTR